jgi:hypothetical protein
MIQRTFNKLQEMFDIDNAARGRVVIGLPPRATNSCSDSTLMQAR